MQDKDKMLSTAGPGSVRHHHNLNNANATQDFSVLSPYNQTSKLISFFCDNFISFCL